MKCICSFINGFLVYRVLLITYTLGWYKNGDFDILRVPLFKTFHYKHRNMYNLEWLYLSEAKEKGPIEDHEKHYCEAPEDPSKSHNMSYTVEFVFITFALSCWKPCILRKLTLTFASLSAENPAHRDWINPVRIIYWQLFYFSSPEFWDPCMRCLTLSSINRIVVKLHILKLFYLMSYNIITLFLYFSILKFLYVVSEWVQ